MLMRTFLVSSLEDRRSLFNNGFRRFVTSTDPDRYYYQLVGQEAEKFSAVAIELKIYVLELG